MSKWEYMWVTRKLLPELDSSGQYCMDKPKQWDYKRDDMDQFGATGWELVQIKFSSYDEYYYDGSSRRLTLIFTETWYFKRQIE